MKLCVAVNFGVKGTKCRLAQKERRTRNEFSQEKEKKPGAL